MTRRSTATAGPRTSHAGALRALAGHDLEALAATVDEQVAGEGVCFHSTVGDEAFLIDPVPRVLDAHEWDDDRGRARPARARAQRASSPTSTPSGGSSPRASCPSA